MSSRTRFKGFMVNLVSVAEIVRARAPGALIARANPSDVHQNVTTLGEN
jgi:hypothetical protein